MNRQAFFNAVRSSVFRGSLSQPQVDGMNALMDAGLRYGLTNPHHMANVLAQVFRETGGYMLGIKETVFPSHNDKNPSDPEVIRRLDRAWANGQLKGVKTPYWRDGWFGRGPIQITHRDNYVKMGKAVGADLVGNPNLAMDKNVGASIAVIGMRDGLFRNRKLSGYSFPAALDAPQSENPRRIVNGNDGSDKEVADNHRKFHAALIAAAWGSNTTTAPNPSLTPPVRPTPEPSQPDSNVNWIGLAIIAIIGAAAALFGINLSN